MQRFLDMTISALALVLLSPLLLPIMLLLRLTGEGEIFFVQQRVGRDGKMFGLLKFATMLKNSPHIGTGTVTVKGDPRILPMGGFLRGTKINELPQIANILMGDMSLVGPRPQTQRCFDAFTAEVQALIVQVRPGLTGIGSIIFRDEENMLDGKTDQVAYYDTVIAPYKGEVERWYLANQGTWTYVMLIFTTAWVVLFPRSGLVWRLFPGLPTPPASLAAAVGYPGAANS